MRLALATTPHGRVTAVRATAGPAAGVRAFEFLAHSGHEPSIAERLLVDQIIKLRLLLDTGPGKPPRR